MINEDIIMQGLDTLREKTAQAQTKARELTNKFHTLVRAIEEPYKD
jgi:hypothetical protein